MPHEKGKGKVVPMLFFLTKHNAMKAHWRSGSVAPRSIGP